MRLSDISVEVRDKDLNRLGVIKHDEMVLKHEGLYNKVGTWELELPFEHRLTEALRTPGSGIIVTSRVTPAPWDVLFSGPTTKPELTQTPADPGGTVTFTGVTDSIRLADTVALPTPANGDTYVDDTGHDERTGPVETLMHEYVAANIGPTYPNSGRSIPELTMGTDLGRGRTVTKRPRYTMLGELLQELSLIDQLGFRIVQRGNVLVFETYDSTDRSASIRLDPNNGTLAGQRVSHEAPTITRAIVAGQGDLEDRQLVAYSSAAAQQAETDWGRRVESFIDQRNTDDPDELQDAAEEALEKGGFTAVNVQATPFDDSAMVFGVDWGLGDIVTTVLDGTELRVYVTGIVMRVDDKGFEVGVTLGSTYANDGGAGSAGGSSQSNIAKRISALERNVSATDPASKADVNHNHDADYAAKDHNHDGVYAFNEHTHSQPFLSVWHTDTSRSPGEDSVVSWTNTLHAEGGASVSSATLNPGEPGLYHFDFGVDADNASGGEVLAYLEHKGTGKQIIHSRQSIGQNGIRQHLSGSKTVRVTQGDEYRLRIALGGGAPDDVTIRGGEAELYFTSVRIAD